MKIKKIAEEYFVKKNYTWIGGLSTLSKESKTVPFNISGGVQFETIFSGEKIVSPSFIANIQLCIRTSRLESIGKSGRHHICFEMLGHFSFGHHGDYVKVKMIRDAYYFLISVGLNHKKIAATVDKEDIVSTKAWNDLGVNVIVLNNKKVVEATKKRSGYQTEIMYKVGQGDTLLDYREIWNIVFYEFGTSSFREKLEIINADSGASVDRILSAIEGVDSNYKNSNWLPYLNTLNLDEACVNHCYVAELLKAVCNLSNEDNFSPGPKGAEYEFRKMVRRLYVEIMSNKLDSESLIRNTFGYFNLIHKEKIIYDEFDKFKFFLDKNYNVSIEQTIITSRETDNYLMEKTGLPLFLIQSIRKNGGVKWI